MERSGKMTTEAAKQAAEIVARYNIPSLIATTLESSTLGLEVEFAKIGAIMAGGQEKLFPAKFSHFSGLTCQNCGSKIEKGLNECQMCGERKETC